MCHVSRVPMQLDLGAQLCSGSMTLNPKTVRIYRMSQGNETDYWRVFLGLNCIKIIKNTCIKS